MKKIIFILVLFSIFSFKSKEKSNSISVFIDLGSQLVIKGTTNVNSFKCDFNIKEINKAIPLYYKIIDDRMVFEKASLILSNDCFDCGNKGMNRDFSTLLKSNEYPEILLELKEVSKNANASSVVNASIELHIAGKSKLYDVPLELKVDENIGVFGSLKLNISDFELEAPKKAFGLIVVSEDIEINFNLIFKECKS